MLFCSDLLVLRSLSEPDPALDDQEPIGGRRVRRDLPEVGRVWVDAGRVERGVVVLGNCDLADKMGVAYPSPTLALYRVIRIARIRFVVIPKPHGLASRNPRSSPPTRCPATSIPEVGGLHHRYERRAA